MSARNISCESESLEVIAELNGRGKSNVFLRRKMTREFILIDDINPAALSQREGFLASLLSDLAEAIAVARAGSKEEEPEGRGQAIAFADTDPWPSPVDGAELLGEISGILKRFVVTSDAQRDAISLFILHTHAHGAAQVSPILNLTSAEKRSGKTTAATVVGALVPRPVKSANLTPATLFRVIERYHPTIIADEIDAYLHDRQELRGILNSSHLRSSAFVVRLVGEDFEPRIFSTWAPIILIGLRANRQHDTIQDRSIIIELRRRTSAEHVDRCSLPKLEAICEQIRQKAVRWAGDHIEEVSEADPVVPTSLNDRAADNWHNMLAIADLVGGNWPKRARDAALVLSGDAESSTDTSPGILRLSDLRRFYSERSFDRAPTADLLAWLRQEEDRPWSEWRRGQAITAQGLASLLEPYHVAPKVIRTGKTTHRGYELEQFADAFLRYLPSHPKQVSHLSSSSIYPSSDDVTAAEPVTDETVTNSFHDNTVTDVTDSEDRGEAWEPDAGGGFASDA
jgi:putative DNA primase/helicase